MAADGKHSGLMLGLLLGKGKPKGAAEPDDGAPDDDKMDLGSEGLTSAMKDFHAALHAADFEAMGEAFKDAVSLSDNDDDNDGDEAEDGQSADDEK